MSEKVQAQDTLFEWGGDTTSVATFNRLDDDPAFVELCDRISEKFHLDPELAGIGAAWAMDWWQGLQTEPSSNHDGSQRPTEAGNAPYAPSSEWTKKTYLPYVIHL